MCDDRVGSRQGTGGSNGDAPPTSLPPSRSSVATPSLGVCVNRANLVPLEVHTPAANTKDPGFSSCAPFGGEGSATSLVKLGPLLHLLQELLRAHEVKFSLLLLETLAHSNLSSSTLSISRQELARHLRPFSDKHTPSSHLAGASELVASTVVQLVSPSAAGPSLGDGHRASSSAPSRRLSGSLRDGRKSELPHLKAILPTRANTETSQNKLAVAAVLSKKSRRRASDPNGLKGRGEHCLTVPGRLQTAANESALENVHPSPSSPGPGRQRHSAGDTHESLLDLLAGRVADAACVAPQLPATVEGALPGTVASPDSPDDHVGGCAQHVDRSPSLSSVTSSLPSSSDGDNERNGEEQRAEPKYTSEGRPKKEKSDLLRVGTHHWGSQMVTKSDDLEDLSLDQIAWLATPSDSWILHPNYPGRVAWDLLALVFILFECVTLPLAMSFELDMPAQVHTVSTTFFSMDILLSFATGYFHGSLLIMRRSWLTTRYMQTWFTLDVVSTIPWEAILSTGMEQGSDAGDETTLLRVVKLGKLARVIRLLRFAKITTLMKRFQSSGLMPASMYQLKFGMAAIRMFVVFGFLSHWTACVWGWIGDAANIGHSTVGLSPYELISCTMGGPCEPGVEGSPWKRRYGLDNFDRITQYIVALQYTAALMTGGEAPMQPSHALERIFTIVMMISSVFISSVVVGEILLIMNRQAELNMSFDELMQHSREFMVARQIPAKLQVRVYRYLESKQQTERGHNGSNRDFITHLSGWLQVELIESMNRVHVCRHPFFKEIADDQVIRRICLEAAPMTYGAGDVVVEVGQPARSMAFLVRGKLHVDINEEGRGGLYLKPPCWIGDKCIFVDTLRANTVRAVTSSETLSIEKTSVVSICADWPDVKSLYERFRREVMENGWKMLRCTVCQDIGHTEETCPAKALEDARRMSMQRTEKRSRTSVFQFLGVVTADDTAPAL